MSSVSFIKFLYVFIFLEVELYDVSSKILIYDNIEYQFKNK